MKRITAFLLACCLLITLCTAAAAVNPAPTEAEAYARMVALKAQYPEGTTWTNSNYYGWKGGVYTGGYGCVGFAFLLSDAAFGDLPARKLSPVDISMLRAGDILRMNNDSHTVIVLEVRENSVILAEGNYNSSVHWGREITAAQVAAADYMLTRYPADHLHNYTDAVTAPTCLEYGYTTHSCIICGEQNTDTYVNALGHSYQDGVCTRCGEKDPNATAFSDVSALAWYAEAVQYMTENGLMNGIGAKKFDPEGTMTRAMLVTVLWRYAGAPEAKSYPFTDVAAGKWYEAAVAWAAENGIVTGVSADKFNPDGAITREQLAAIFYRYADGKSADADFTRFEDGEKVSAWAKDALQWAIETGLVGGSADGGKLYLNPKNSATRAQVAAIFYRYIENAK